MVVDIKEMNGMFVVEWNRRQKHLQIQALGEILKGNLLAAVNGRDSGYFPLANRTNKGRSPRNVEAYRDKAKNLAPVPSSR